MGRTMSQPHKERAHSIFSASGSERWLNCAASVVLEENSPKSSDTVWSVEGTKGHEVLEWRAKIRFKLKSEFEYNQFYSKNWGPVTVNGEKHTFSFSEMEYYAEQAVDIVYKVYKTLVDPVVGIEQRVYNEDLHKEMFGTVDNYLAELWGTLHVFDYKYGTGHVVDPKKNTQMIQYALALANKYDWQFSNVVVHIIQPRAGGNIHKEWTLSIDELRDNWRPLWVKGVARVDRGGNKPFTGSWCFWCRAGGRNVENKITCPAKRAQITEKRADKINDVFATPFDERNNDNGKKEKSYEEIKPKTQSKGSKKAVEVFAENEVETEEIGGWF